MNPAVKAGSRATRNAKGNRFTGSAIAGTAQRAAARAVTSARNVVPAPSVPQASLTALACIELPACSSLAQVAAFKSTLMSLHDAPEQITLRAEAVVQIDTAMLQVLTAFVGERRRSGRELRWLGVNEVLRDAARQLGLMQALDLPA
jgi:anti-anti-sigma regulatory factor